MTPHRNGLTLGILFAAGTLNLFDRQIINVLAESIKADLQLSDAKLGLLTGTAFGIFYAVMGIPLGRLADRVDRTRLIGLSLLTWSVFTSVSGAAASFLQLFLFRMGVGIGEAGAQPASLALIADTFPPNRRTSAMSLFLASAPFGSFLGLLAGGYIGANWGWRTALFVAGIPGLLLVPLFFTVLRDPGVSRRKQAESPPFWSTFSGLVRRPRYAWLATGMFCSTLLVYVSGAWLPAFFIRVHGMSLTQAGLYTALAVGLGGGIGTLFVGSICDSLRSRVRHVEIKSLIAILIVAIPSLLVVVLVRQAAIALVAMLVFNTCVFAWTGPTATLLQDEAAPENRALAVSVSLSFASILSLGLGLPLTGLLSDTLSAGLGAPGLGYAVAVVAMAAGGLGVVAHLRVLASLRRAAPQDA